MTDRGEHDRPAEGGSLEGASWSALGPGDLERALEHARDYRGDVTLLLDDGTAVSGFLYAVEARGADAHVRVLPSDGGEAVRVPGMRVTGVSFSGSDRAFGASWKAWDRSHGAARRAQRGGRPSGAGDGGEA